MIRILLISALLCLALLMPHASARADTELTIGALSWMAKEEAEKAWQPLVGELSRALPGYRFNLKLMNLAEIRVALESRQLDFILTNPAHYILLKERFQLPSPVATLITIENGRHSKAFGGVIITRAEQTDIATLQDLKGRRIATVESENCNFGSYAVQAYELFKAGLPLPVKGQLVVTGRPQERVVEAVLTGQAEVGFVRTGVLEHLVAQGKLDPARLKVINLQNHPGFPHRASTRLYPEWPFVILPHVDDELARQVASALLGMHHGTSTFDQAHIHGFDIPANYLPVETVMRELRMAPFNAVPAVTMADVWATYRWQIAALLGAVGLIAVLSGRLLVTNRSLQRAKTAAEASSTALLESERKLRQVNENLTLALRASKAGAWDLNVVSGELHWSPELYELFGLDPHHELLSLKSWEGMVHPDDRLTARSVLDRALREKIDLLNEYRLVHGDGTTRWISSHGRGIYDNQGRPTRMTGISIDITERMQIEDALQRSEARYRAIVESQTDYVCRYSPDGALTYMNSAFAGWTGLQKGELLGKSFYAMVHEDDREEMVRTIETLTCQNALATLEIRCQAPDGRAVWHQWAHRAICEGPDQIIEYQGVGRDITVKKEAEAYLANAREILEQEVRQRTLSLSAANDLLSREIEERKRAEQHLIEYQRKLEALSLDLTLATERERARIAGELHDQVGQRLILSRIKFDALASRLPAGDEEPAVVELQQLLEQTLNDIRSLTFQLRPPILASAGLVAALQWLGEELKENYGLTVEIAHEASPINLNYETKSALFQVIRELLLNVAKHAGTDRAQVDIRSSGDDLHLIVTDNGKGFDTMRVLEKRNRSNGFGIFNVRQRIEHLNGILDLKSMPGAGSRATISVPLLNGQAEQ
jgi:PAS domain S-box-containing protein